MQRISILCVGKIKEKFYQQAIDEYAKRLSKYCSLEIIEVSDERTPDNASATEELLIKKREGERLLKYISEESYVVALAIEGKSIDSISFADMIENIGIKSMGTLCFVIGGSLGLDDRLLKKADMLLSFSKLTFPHQLMRVIVLEQIYRGYRIIKGEPYHK